MCKSISPYYDKNNDIKSLPTELNCDLLKKNDIEDEKNEKLKSDLLQKQTSYRRLRD